jgi:serine/threonine protein kinase
VKEPVELLAEEFLERRRRGERPTVEEYEARHPELAAAIRDLFPALCLIEKVSEGSPGVPVGEDRAAATATASGSISSPVPDQLGDYRILREVGRGGMGVVYEAEQGSLGRRVALKVLPPYALTNPVQVRRFEREARAAGRLHHTNIVPVFGVGCEGDSHYYVMQYIQGQPLSEVLAELRMLRKGAAAAIRPGTAKPESGAGAAHPTAPPTAADVARSLWAGVFVPAPAGDLGSADGLAPTATEPKGELPPPPRAESGSQPDSNALVRSASQAHSGRRYARTVARLGVQAAEALEYAAHQGVLHRDVKPSNLLLDVHGTLWVTDFGMAKLADSEDLTHTGDILGTLRYMAPERFRGHSDVRSDIYGLGLTLYELLALRPAFEEADRSRLIDMVTRAELPQLLKVDPSIPRDLATVVHKAIACDPSDRYVTAGELAADLTRFLEDRPIHARRLSLAGVAWRWVKQNPAVASLLGLVALLLLGITAGSMIAANQYRAISRNESQARVVAVDARQLADTRLKESEASAARANAALAEADQSAAESKAVVAFVTGDVLGAAAPSKTRGKEVTVLEALANADRSLQGKFAKEPRVEASVRAALASVYTELGEYDKAEGHAARSLELREKTLGAEHEATLLAMDTLGWAWVRMGVQAKSERGEALYRRMLETCRRTRGEEDDLTLRAMNGLGGIVGNLNKPDERAKLSQRILDVRRRTKGPKAPETLKALHNHALSLWELGKLNEAEPLFREVLEAEIKSDPDDPNTLLTMKNYASLLMQLCRYNDLADWSIRSMDAHLRVLKLKHPFTRDAIWPAVLGKVRLAKIQEAIGIADRVQELARRELSPEDDYVLGCLDLRAGVLFLMGDYEEAGANTEKLLAARTSKLGPKDGATLDALEFLAVIRRQQGELQKARTLLARLSDDAQRALDAGMKTQIARDQAEDLHAKIAMATFVRRNLDRPERSEAAPGTPGGPPRIDAPFQAVSPVADGRIEQGEYLDGNGLAFDFADDHNPGRMSRSHGKKLICTPKDPSDLSVVMHAAHTAMSLYLAFRVRDQSVHADPVAAKSPYLNDCVEVFLDGDRVVNDVKNRLDTQGSAEGLQLLSDVLGNRFTNLRPVGTLPFKVGTSRTADGYIIEFDIPLNQIDTQDGPEFRAATTGSELRMNVTIDDVDESITKQTSIGVLWTEDPLNEPALGGEDYWPVALRLVPASKPDQ